MSDLAQSFLSFLGVKTQCPRATPMADVRPDSTPLSSPITSTTIETLRARVAYFLMVFHDPRYAHLDVPDWVHRVTPHWVPEENKFTVRNLIRTMCDTAAALDLAEGERYVLAAVCACADNPNRGQGTDSPEKEEEALARGLQCLANAWVAFLLWPFYARMEDPESVTKGYASPCTGLAFAPKAMAYGDFDPDECMLESSYPLRDQVLRREGHRCIVTGSWDSNWHGEGAPPGALMPGYVDAVRIFKHPRVVYKDVYDNDKAKYESIMLSMELLRCYCQMSDKYIQGMGSGIMDDPENLISLCPITHSKFDKFGICLVPTQTPNTYQVKDHDPRFIGLPFPSMTLPKSVTFRDHSGAVAVDGQPAPPVSLPNRKLLCMHAALGSVLYTSGVAGIFDRILDILDPKRPDVGDLPVPDPDGVSFWKDLVDAVPDLNHLARLLGITQV
ncbi:hypothetical protein LXA43DRAFT_997405 [Ganoderma leucocontextum]|nr:hypothetical protein LXA43DRAFT_997405 [Ganoderma leucocontextum]